MLSLIIVLVVAVLISAVLSQAWAYLYSLALHKVNFINLST